jgi:hypothetical protein
MVDALRNAFLQDAYGPGLQDVSIPDAMTAYGGLRLAGLAKDVLSDALVNGGILRNETGSILPKRIYGGEMKMPEGTWNSSSPERPPSSMWEPNLGAIPGEPSLVMKNGKAAVLLNEDKFGNQFYTVMSNRGKQFGGAFADHGDASRYAENIFK